MIRNIREKLHLEKLHLEKWRLPGFFPVSAAEWRRRIDASRPLVDGERFQVKLACGEFEMMEAQRLRYEVFVAEQGHRSDAGAPPELDQDEYDATSLHLLVIEKESLRVVGTYRVRPGFMVRRTQGFYSQRQYEIAGLRRISGKVCEVGRSCVAPEFRNGAVVSLLWAGLIELQRRIGYRYLIGCASLETLDPAVGWGLYDWFRRQDKLSAQIACAPLAGYELARPAMPFAGTEAELKRQMPPLLKGYLRLGAQIGGYPSFDPEFGSIDFLIFFDMEQMDARYLRHFGGSAC